MLSHIIPFNEANVEADQPWLKPGENHHAKSVGDLFLREVTDIEPVILEHLKQRVSEGDQEALTQLYPICHYILTTDFRIVQEPNFYRWGLFLERAKHRNIDRTKICEGEERDRSYFSDSWDAQQRRKRGRDTPSFKIQEMFVSTVFIGTGEDELFETMIFGGWLNTACWRCTTLSEAKKNHWDAVTVAHQYKNYMKRRGRVARKDWVRMDQFWRLANKRGREWAVKHLSQMEGVDDRLSKIPGEPNIPQPNVLFDMVQRFLPREKILK